MSNFTAQELRDMLAAAEAAEAAEREMVAASTIVSQHVSGLVNQIAGLTKAAEASGLVAPDLAAILSAAILRAAPVTPDVLADVIAPEPEPVGTDNRRTRRRVERDWTKVTSGEIFTCTLAGKSGRVRIDVSDGRPT